MFISFCLAPAVVSLLLKQGKLTMNLLYYVKVKEGIYQNNCKSLLQEVCHNKSFKTLMVKTSSSQFGFNQQAHLLHFKGLLLGGQHHKQDNYLSFSMQKMKVPSMQWHLSLSQHK
jgi:hypothetical protein